ncbi:MAG TPA: hypothetical protein VLK56_03645 [Solirubrobacterales bacterium]|nr:hypothetical protein [Solirubrobacterales bacterium]
MPELVTDWSASTRLHTFQSGRTAEIRTSPNLLAMLDLGIDLETGAVSPGAMRAICGLLMVRPRLLEPGEEPKEGESAVAWEDLGESEELLEIWREVTTKADTFRQERLRARAGANGEVLDDDAQSDAGAPARKRARRPA